MWRWTFGVAMLCAALVDANPFKRAEMSASPFVLSSRYGRSPPRMLAPRNDRFFMSGRYGKRSDMLEDSERINFSLTDNIQNEDDKFKEQRDDGEIVRDSDILPTWRSRCDCAPFEKGVPQKSYFKRKPEDFDSTPEED